MQKNIYINGSVGKLNVLLDLPELSIGQKCPLIIFCHGFRGNLNFHLWPLLIAPLNEHGIGVLRFDFNGCGKSDGQFQNMTVESEIDDLMNVIAYARSLSETENISILGHSQGGVVAGMAAGMCGEIQVKSLVLLSAASVLRDDALRGNMMGANYDPWNLDKAYYDIPGDLKIGREYIRNSMNLPIYETTAKYRGPAFVLNGMADRIVPYTYAIRYQHVLANGELCLVPG